jgi:hypothetical protein
MKENDSLKAKLASIKKELHVSRQRNPNELTLDILALTTTVMNQNREHMCYECGNIYFQEGYKILKVPVVGHDEESTNFSVKKE